MARPRIQNDNELKIVAKGFNTFRGFASLAVNDIPKETITLNADGVPFKAHVNMNYDNVFELEDKESIHPDLAILCRKLLSQSIIKVDDNPDSVVFTYKEYSPSGQNLKALTLTPKNDED